MDVKLKLLTGPKHDSEVTVRKDQLEEWYVEKTKTFNVEKVLVYRYGGKTPNYLLYYHLLTIEYSVTNGTTFPETLNKVLKEVI